MNDPGLEQKRLLQAELAKSAIGGEPIKGVDDITATMPAMLPPE